MNSTKATYEKSLEKVKMAKRRMAEKWKSAKQENEELKERLASSIQLSSPLEGGKGAQSSLSLVRKYEEVTKALLLQKSENRRLTNYLNQILREMEQKVFPTSSGSGCGKTPTGLLTFRTYQ